MFFSGRDWETCPDRGKDERSKVQRSQDKSLNVLEWPSQSPDLNLIKHLWRDLKIAEQRGSPSNLTELEGSEHYPDALYVNQWSHPPHTSTHPIIFTVFMAPHNCPILVHILHLWLFINYKIWLCRPLKVSVLVCVERYSEAEKAMHRC